MIEVLFEGLHENRFYPDGHYHIEPLRSSVTLIRDEGVNILFDTGSLAVADLLVEELKKRGLAPRDIHHVFNSHYHLDHCFNDYLFAKTALIHTYNATILPNGSVDIYPNPDLRLLPSFLKTLKTPGHTGSDMSLIYHWEGKTWVLAGDAVREDFIRQETPLSAGNKKDFFENMKLVFQSGDIIVPGHGRVIRGEVKKELEGLLKEWPVEMLEKGCGEKTKI